MLKRDAKLFGRALVPALTVTFCFLILLVFSVPLFADSVRTRKEPLQISLVHQDNSVMLDKLLHAVTDSDLFADLLTAHYEEDLNRAMDGLRAGTCDGIIVLPENFLHDYTSGINTPALLITSVSSPAESLAVSQLVPVAEDLLELGQGGAWAVLGLPSVQNLSQEAYHDLYLDINFTLLRAALSVTSQEPNLTELPLTGTLLPLPLHYFTVFYLFFALLSSCFFVPLFSSDLDAALLRRLSVLGVTPQRFLLPKLLYMTSYQFCLACTVFLLLRRSFFFELRATGWLALFVFSLFQAALALFFFTLPDKRSALLCIVLLSFAGLFCTGGLLPMHYLPAAFSTVNILLPAGISYRLAALFCGAQLSAGWITAALLLSLCAWAATVFLLKYRKKEGAF